MIEDVKNILKKLLELPDRFEGWVKYDIEKHKVYVISYKVDDINFSISPSRTSSKNVRIYKDEQLIRDINCTDNDYLEISLLTAKLYKIYEDRIYNKFVHSLD